MVDRWLEIAGFARPVMAQVFGEISCEIVRAVCMRGGPFHSRQTKAELDSQYQQTTVRPVRRAHK